MHIFSANSTTLPLSLLCHTLYIYIRRVFVSVALFHFLQVFPLGSVQVYLIRMHGFFLTTTISFWFECVILGV